MPLGMMMHLANNFSERRWWKRETEKVQALLQLEKYLEKFTSDQGSQSSIEIFITSISIFNI